MPPRSIGHFQRHFDAALQSHLKPMIEHQRCGVAITANVSSGRVAQSIGTGSRSSKS